MVAKYSGRRAYGSESVISEHVTTEMMIRFQGESLETGNILLYSNSDADVCYTSELIQESQKIC
jgi:hypothetical protein